MLPPPHSIHFTTTSTHITTTAFLPNTEQPHHSVVKTEQPHHSVVKTEQLRHSMVKTEQPRHSVVKTSELFIVKTEANQRMEGGFEDITAAP